MDTSKILILGVTASGKARLAHDLARELGAEIISIDSMKVYRRMDIGTAKPPKQAQERVKYHLIDVVEPSEPFSVGRFLELADQTIASIEKADKPIIAVGGTALYIKALLYGLFDGPGSDEKIRTQLKQAAEELGLSKLHEQLRQVDPAAAERIHPNDAKRIIRALEVYKLTGKGISQFQQQFDAPSTTKNWTIIGLCREKAQESSRINQRVKRMIAEGLVDEVKALLEEAEPLSKQAACAIGYAEIIDHLKNDTPLEDAIESIKKNSRKLAKAQRTWFKTFKGVNWLQIAEDESSEEIFQRANALLQSL